MDGLLLLFGKVPMPILCDARVYLVYRNPNSDWGRANPCR